MGRTFDFGGDAATSSAGTREWLLTSRCMPLVSFVAGEQSPVSDAASPQPPLQVVEA